MGYHQHVEIRLISETTIGAISKLQALMKSKKDLLGTKELPKIIFADLSDTSKLGYYDSKQNLIVIDERIAKGCECELEAVFLHELSHFKNWSENSLLDHGPEFRRCCTLLGVPEGFDKAKIKRSEERRKAVSDKVEKLIALSSSPFEAEAISALKKAQQLMLEYNIAPKEEENKLYAVSVMKKNRFFYHEKLLMQTVQMLSGTMSVIEKKRNGKNEAVFYGNLEQVEFSMYLWEYLMEEMEKCVKEEKKKRTGFDKGSFCDGLANGLLSRIRENTSKEVEKALTSTVEGTRIIYNHLMNTRLHYRRFSYGIKDLGSYNSGKNAAGSITIPTNGHKTGYKRIGSQKKT